MRIRRFGMVVGVIRAFMLVLSSAVACQSAAAADPVDRVHRLGFLGQTSAAAFARQTDALRQGLRSLGYEDGRNLAIEYRWAEGKLDRLPALARELVEKRVDVIVTHGSAGSRAAKWATATIPIVIAVIGDPVANGVVNSLDRPGSNVTGLVLREFETTGRWFELLKETVPTISRIGMLDVPDVETAEAAEGSRRKEDDAARSRGLEIQRAVVRGNDDLDGAFAILAQRGAQAIVVPNTSLLNPLATAISGLAVKHRLPAIGSLAFARSGGLLGYGPDPVDMYRRAAGYVDAILKGARPGNLAMEGPPRFELIVNSRTARAIEATIPKTLLDQATESIE
jgi:putative ABC transport system substrate-binding protein